MVFGCKEVGKGCAVGKERVFQSLEHVQVEVLVLVLVIDEAGDPVIVRVPDFDGQRRRRGEAEGTRLVELPLRDGAGVGADHLGVCASGEHLWVWGGG